MDRASIDPTPATATTGGFTPLVAPRGFVRLTGEFHLHEVRPVLAMRVTPDHLNSIRIAHGGLLATLADTALGVVLKRQLELPSPPATVSLTLDYLGGVREGDWAEAEVEVHKVGRRITNASCIVRVDGRAVVRASGVFMITDSSSRKPSSSTIRSTDRAAL
jgi:uncharacterized protein (TIGR00369 family)